MAAIERGLDTVSSRRARGTSSWVIPALWWLRSNSSLAFEFLTAGLGVVAFAVTLFVPISENTLVAITIALLALLSISALLQRVTKLEQVDRRIESVHDFVHHGKLEALVRASAASASEAVRSVEEAGVVAVHRNLGRAGLAEQLSAAEHSVRIMSNWVGLLPDIDEILARKAEDGCEVQVLVLQHTAKFAEMRNDELGWGDGRVAREISGDLERFERLLIDHPRARGNLVVRAFSSRPAICMFAFDDVRLVGFYLPRMDAMKGPFLRVVGEGRGDAATVLGAIVDNQFDELWNDPSTKYVHLAAGEPTYVDDIEKAWARGDILERVMRSLRPEPSVENLPNRDSVVEDLRADGSRLAECVAAARQAIQLSNMDSLLFLAAVLEEAGHVDEAEQLLSSALELGHSSPILRYAPLLAKRNRLGDAEIPLRSCSSSNDEIAPIARSWLVRLLDSTGRRSEADSLLLKWARSGDHASRHDLFRRLMASSQYSEAEKLLRDAPDDLVARSSLIQLLVGQGRYDEANAVMRSRSPRYRIHRGD